MTTSNPLASSLSRIDSITLMRVAVGLLLTIHGIARIWLGIVDEFGTFLSAVGFPTGGVLAWMVTIGELIGGPVLMLGRVTRPLCIWFAMELTLGIVLVHARDGWFVVGAGRNGMEYSALLLVCLLAVFIGTQRAEASGHENSKA